MTDSTIAAGLEIRVRTEHTQGRTSLTYVLYSPSDVLDLDPVSISGKPSRGRPTRRLPG